MLGKGLSIVVPNLEVISLRMIIIAQHKYKKLEKPQKELLN